MRFYLLLFIILSFHDNSWSSEVPGFPFVSRHMSAPEPKVMWLTPVLKQRAQAILEHPFGALRIRYWQQGGRTAWVLDEIGKEQPITCGVIVEDGRIRVMDVLAYRESRGGEVQQSFFTDRFSGAAISGPADALSQRIDGITGATLSVAALRKIARLALLFDSQRPQ